MYIAQNIKYLREQKKMQGKELATILGVAQSSISHYESGRMNPSFDTVEKMCDLFGVNAHQLLMIDLASGADDKAYRMVEEAGGEYLPKEDVGLWDYRKLVEEVEKLKSIVETLKTESS